MAALASSIPYCVYVLGLPIYMSSDTIFVVHATLHTIYGLGLWYLHATNTSNRLRPHIISRTMSGEK